jgi:hypothetical protein
MAKRKVGNQTSSLTPCLPMEFRMKILVLNETLRGFHPPIKLADNPHDQWN